MDGTGQYTFVNAPSRGFSGHSLLPSPRVDFTHLDNATPMDLLDTISWTCELTNPVDFIGLSGTNGSVSWNNTTKKFEAVFPQLSVSVGKQELLQTGVWSGSLTFTCKIGSLQTFTKDLVIDVYPSTLAGDSPHLKPY